MNNRQINEIHGSHYNHGVQPEIIATICVEHEIRFKPEDIIALLNNIASDSMAKIINTIGESFNKDQFAECRAADDLDEHGKRFIEDMHYFIAGVEKGGKAA